MVDLKELARRLGLSMTTVSRALNGYPDVSAKTRERVVRMARELGYTPNALARRLTVGRSETVGFVPQAMEPYFGNPYFADLLAGMGEALYRAGFDLVLAGLHDDVDALAACRRLVAERRVDAIVLDRTYEDDPRVEYLLLRGFPFVTLGRDRWAQRHAWLDSDGRRATLALTRALIAAGHRRIAFIAADMRFNFVADRVEGYREALAWAGIAPDPLLLRHEGFSERGGAAATSALLALAAPPTAILCIEDLTAIGAMRALRAAGLEPGRDVAVVGYNDIPLAAATEPPLSTFRMPVREAGRRLAEVALALAAGADAAAFRELWMPRFIARGSHHWRGARGPLNLDLSPEAAGVAR